MESRGSNGPSSSADHLVDLPAITLEQPEATTGRVSAKVSLWRYDEPGADDPVPGRLLSVIADRRLAPR